jgi:hypothetical protein
MTRSAQLFLAVVLAVLAVAVAPPAASPHIGTPRWSMTTLMTRLDGARVTIGSWRGRVRTESTLCSGEGTGVRWNGVRHWRHFICTWTTFRAGGLDRDVTFRVHTLTRSLYVLTSAHFGAS